MKGHTAHCLVTLCDTALLLPAAARGALRATLASAALIPATAGVPAALVRAAGIAPAGIATTGITGVAFPAFAGCDKAAFLVALVFTRCDLAALATIFLRQVVLGRSTATISARVSRRSAVTGGAPTVSTLRAPLRAATLIPLVLSHCFIPPT